MQPDTLILIENKMNDSNGTGKDILNKTTVTWPLRTTTKKTLPETEMLLHGKGHHYFDKVKDYRCFPSAYLTEGSYLKYI